jgi:hypothetical protein
MQEKTAQAMEVALTQSTRIDEKGTGSMRCPSTVFDPILQISHLLSEFGQGQSRPSKQGEYEGPWDDPSESL